MRATTFYRAFELRRRDKTTRIVEIFAGACPEIAFSTASSVAAAKRWIDGYIDLEQIIEDLVDRKEACTSPAELRLINRELIGLYYGYENAAGIIEDLDEDWGSIACGPLPATEHPQRQVVPLTANRAAADDLIALQTSRRTQPMSAFGGKADIAHTH
jgi:hypothetical protein